jgi:peptidoglycan/LPS O-acetylase OafA/YrhL
VDAAVRSSARTATDLPGLTSLSRVFGVGYRGTNPERSRSRSRLRRLARIHPGHLAVWLLVLTELGVGLPQAVLALVLSCGLAAALHHAVEVPGHRSIVSRTPATHRTPGGAHL